MEVHASADEVKYMSLQLRVGNNGMSLTQYKGKLRLLRLWWRY